MKIIKIKIIDKINLLYYFHPKFQYNVFQVLKYYVLSTYTTILYYNIIIVKYKV